MNETLSKLRLDVGCGDHPQGNVNSDLYLTESPHLHKRRIDPKKCPNFVRCDAHYLPFRNNVFEEVLSSHLLEHLGNPSEVLKEMLRVSSYKVTFIVPHRMRRGFREVFYPRFAKEHHKIIFTYRNIDSWLRRIGLTFDIFTRYRILPHRVFPIVQIPWDIMVTVYKPY